MNSKHEPSPLSPPPKPPRTLLRDAVSNKNTPTENYNAYDIDDRVDTKSPIEQSAPVTRQSDNDWLLQSDADGNIYYTHPNSIDQWVPTDYGGGQTYFYEKNSRRLTWELPPVDFQSHSNSSPAGRHSMKPFPEYPSSPIQPVVPCSINTIDLSEAKAKFGARKLPVSRSRDNLSNFLPKEESANRGYRITKAHITGPIENKIRGMERRGLVTRTKFTVNGGRVTQKWVSSILVINGPILYVYKGQRGSSSSGKPEMEFHIKHLEVLPVDGTITTRENVFLLRDSTDPSKVTEYLIEAPSVELRKAWETALQYSQDIHKENRFDPQGFSTSPPPNVDQRVIVMLRDFFRRRPTSESVKALGILKNEPVFGSVLTELCEREQTNVPTFVTRVIRAIESRGLEAVGLYRKSGSGGSIQKLRNQVNHSEYSLNSTEWDVYELSDSLKLFMRELKEPLLSYALYNDILEFNRTVNHYSSDQNVDRIRQILRRLPNCHFATTKLLFQHLNKVATLESVNQMNSSNLAIVFAPNIMWPESPTTSYEQFSAGGRGCTEFMITHCTAIFDSSAL